MRPSRLFQTAMASSFIVCRLHMRGRGRLGTCLETVKTVLRRSVGTDAAAAPGEAARNGDSDENKKGRLKSFYDVQAERIEQAERSVLISCPSLMSEKTFLKYLSSHGSVKTHFFYKSLGLYAVVEFESQRGVASLLDRAAIPTASQEVVVPFKSRLVSLRHRGPVGSSNHQLGHLCKTQAATPINALIQRLSRQDSIDRQIASLTDAFQITEENTRLRFLVCSLVKDVAAAYFPECTIKPFGSSVNGFGKLGCDLDMFLDLDCISGRNIKKPNSGLFVEYQMKRVNSERSVTQSILSVLAECVEHLGVGCVGVHKILNARCPLVRFSHQPSGFQCDLTANNRVAMKSSELLYLYGQLDPRVRSLVVAVRCWARAHGITSSSPGAWITNFSLTIMVLFFLQKRSTPIIPTLDHLRDLAGPEDSSKIEGNDCTFVSDLSKIQLTANTETLEHLLCEFLEFYATFDFSSMSINIREGKEQGKPEVAPLYIQNPFETSLNVSKNVNGTQVERFVGLCQESLWLLQKAENRAPQENTEGDIPAPWGLASILMPLKMAGAKGRKRKFQPRTEMIKGLLESLKNKSQLKNS